MSEITSNKIYNITRSHSNTITLGEAANLIQKIVGKGSIKIVDRDLNFPSRGRLSIERAQQDFNFDPKINVEQGFERYINWLQTSTYWQSIL